MRAKLLADAGIGMLAGFVATKITDKAQRLLWEATPSSEKEREPDVEGSSARSAAALLCQKFGLEPTDRELGVLKQVVHYGLGAGWGSLYGLFRRRSAIGPFGAGVATGTSLSLIVDEALNPALGITPPSREFPASSHLRGLATHLVYGCSVAIAAEGLHRLCRSYSTAVLRHQPVPASLARNACPSFGP